MVTVSGWGLQRRDLVSVGTSGPGGVVVRINLFEDSEPAVFESDSDILGVSETRAPVNTRSEMVSTISFSWWLRHASGDHLKDLR